MRTFPYALILLLAAFSKPISAFACLVPVNIWAENYLSHQPIADAIITDLETEEFWETGADGYIRTELEEGRLLTLKFHKIGFPDIQTASVTLAKNGLNDPMHEITLQIPGQHLYNILEWVFGTPQAGMHTVVVEVERCDSNLHRHQDHGEPGAQVDLEPLNKQNIEGINVIYLGKVPIIGITEWIGPILSVRFPFLNWLVPKSSSRDGGVVFTQVPSGEYKIVAHKKTQTGEELQFTESYVKIGNTSPRVINVSTPQGPRSQECDL